ncbi:MAG: hypothetical protein WAV09_02640 [Minisyncoccia bacterium]
MKRPLIIFIVAFLLNLVWENLHSLLYDNYKGVEITQLILLKATLGDAVMIVLITLPFVILVSFRKHLWGIALIGLIVAISIEWYALGTSRWAYNEYMPIIPILLVGLTPTIQLGLLGYLSFKIQEHMFKH